MEYLQVFLTGGAICLIGQALIDFTKLTPARILVIFVVAGAVLTGLGIYEPIVNFGKSGATVPLPGFGYALASGAMDAVKSEGLMGAMTGGVKNTAAGITGAIVFGYFIALMFSAKPKK